MKKISVLLLIIFFSCSYCKLKTAKRVNPKNNLCSLLNKCIDLRKTNPGSNAELNNIIPILEEASGIESTCRKGYFGYLYCDETDSLYFSDMKKWRDKFGCSEINLDSIYLTLEPLKKRMQIKRN